MAIVQTGSNVDFQFVVTGATGTITTALTVPADAEIALVGISTYVGTGPAYTGMTLTKGAVDTAMTKAASGDAITNWEAGHFYLALPDTGTNKTLKYTLAASSGGIHACASVTFWKGIDTASPVRSSQSAQGGTFPLNTASLTALSGDKIIAFAGLYDNTNAGGVGSVITWNNLTQLALVSGFAEACGVWATSNPSGNGTVGIQSTTLFTEGGLCALVLKPSGAAAGIAAKKLITSQARQRAANW